MENEELYHVKLQNTAVVLLVTSRETQNFKSGAVQLPHFLGDFLVDYSGKLRNIVL